MSEVLDPIVSEFESLEQEASYDSWFRAKVQQALDDPRPPIAHDEVVRRMELRLSKLRALDTH